MRKLQGVVLSNKMQKTVTVRIDRLKKHPRYLKQYLVSKKYKAHDETGEYKIGDVVVIEETRPMSKGKRWKVAGLVKRASTAQEKESDAVLSVEQGAKM